MNTRDWGEAAAVIGEGKLGVIPTDTLYGVVCQALRLESVERLYRVRGRSPSKPCIVLIPAIESLEHFGITLGRDVRARLAEWWPGAVSVILPVPEERYAYLHRGLETVAFRLPDHSGLLGLLGQTGPLVAPSANPEGLPPAKTVDEAEAYFGGNVDVYLDGGRLSGEPSTLVAFEEGHLTVLRQGTVRIIERSNK